MIEGRGTHTSRVTVFHIAIVGMSLLLTLVAWQYALQQVETRSKLRFDASSNRVLGLIAERMRKYEDALWSGVAAVESHGGDISYESWHDFARNLRIDERYPGINGIGVIHYQTEESLPAYLTRQQAERPDFRVYPDHAMPEYMPITYIEPEAENAAAVGLDVAHEANRRSAALSSRNSGQARITGPIVLVQDSGQTPGFLFYAPFYQGGPPNSFQERRERFTGAVYAPFVVHKLVDGLLSRNVRDVSFSIRDGDVLIFDEHNMRDADTDPDPMFSTHVGLDLYGRTWDIDIRSNMAFRQENTQSKPTIILLAGLLIEALIVTLLYQMSRANTRAVDYAERVTARLKQESIALENSNMELSQKNEELEQYAYVTSHDLKTPIRGIGGLTEIIREDLEEYFDAPGANTEVRENLDRILDRVNRMEQLTRGILELSKVIPQTGSGAPILLPEVVSEMSQDFDLSPGQLMLDSEVSQIGIDTMNFRRVLENLVGNAIKYHDAPDRLQIIVRVRSAGDRCHVSVMDNGPGIDSRFHNRIFDVFQTLRGPGSPESTGIGLAIVKKAVKQHGGDITLSSTPGEGASFSFDWPLTDQPFDADVQAA